MFWSHFDPRRYRKKFNGQDYSTGKISVSLYNDMPQDTRLCEIWGSRGSTDEDLSFMWYSSFGTWWHTVTPWRGSEGEIGEWSV